MRIFLVSFLLFSLASCNEGVSVSDLSGLWYTEECEEMFSDTGVPLDRWREGVFLFTDTGTIHYRSQLYLDASCTIRDEAGTSSDMSLVATYRLLGDQTLQEGIAGQKISISLVDSLLEPTADAFFTQETGSLCFSSGYRFAPDGLRFQFPFTTEIDFLRCLIP